VVGNDEKVGWDAAGKSLTFGPGKDTVAFIDISKPAAPKVAHSIPLENTIIGPPVNLAIHPSGKLALVASSMSQTKDGETWKPVPDTKVHVFDLEAKPPKVIASIEAGKQPSGLSISAKGDLALVANRADNSISVLAISGKEVKNVGTVPMGDSVAHVAITPDGKRALAIKPVANKVALLAIDGTKVTYDKYDMPVGVFPYNVAITPNGQLALVNNNGAGGGSDGGVDTVAVIDLTLSQPRVIDYVVIGDAPEGLAISPKGDFAVTVLLRGSNADPKAFYYNKGGSVIGLKISGKKVTRGNEIVVGGLPEGVAFSPKGDFVYVGNFIDADLSILKVEGGKLVDTKQRLKLGGHPASLR
jgi:DNA-binding beta-propeller fold protein YncE